MEVQILGEDDKALRCREVPYLAVVGGAQPAIVNVG